MPFPDIDPVLLQIGPFALRWYALAYVAGIVIGWRYAVSLTRNASIWRGTTPTADEKQIDDLVLWVTLGVIAGGRLGYVLFYKPNLFWTDPVEIFRTWNGGMSFHGGLIGVSLALVGFAVTNKLNLLRLADITAPAVPIGLFFGRLANFINGELWGRPTTGPWGMVFPNAGPEPRHPSQLYEAGLEGILLFCILRWATHGAKQLPRRGFVSGLFLVGYGLFRILLEGVREPDRDMPAFPLGLTMGIMLSVPMLLAGVGLILYSRRPGALAPLAPVAAPIVADEPEAKA
ncbi:MAG: prolipoprotein diacylglyceryl transferase [Caulobacterales bacterium 32-69-10]|nr:MAG: prolipoprotein diacylglyceryl transferase [Caulobacterales bacterium 32-69-10]